MSDNKQHYFHFTLGPVQGFVSQARRTRDFWAGSFILSWLAAVAIQAVKHQDGKVEFPKPDEDYMAWLIGKGKSNKPMQGSIPNRFKGLVAAVNPDTFKPEQVVDAVQEAWKALADSVWERDLGDFSPSSEASLIWERQIGSFWDMSWVITPEQNDSSALDKRHLTNPV
jgi:CRISPR-associated protein Cmr2